jgi:hypothetical protein
MQTSQSNSRYTNNVPYGPTESETFKTDTYDKNQVYGLNGVGTNTQRFLEIKYKN